MNHCSITQSVPTQSFKSREAAVYQLAVMEVCDTCLNVLCRSFSLVYLGLEIFSLRRLLYIRQKGLLKLFFF